jgi:hypothetical protein
MFKTNIAQRLLRVAAQQYFAIGLNILIILIILQK